MGPTEIAALIRISEKMRGFARATFSPQAPGILQYRGFAVPNQPGRRKLQDDRWQLPDTGAEAVKELSPAPGSR